MEPIEMNPLNLPSNSKNSRSQPQQTIEPPKAPIVTVKTPWYRKFTNAMFAEDSTSVKSFILRDIIVPTIKDTVYEIVTGGLHMAMYGNTKARPGKKGIISSNSNSYVGYGGMYAANSASSRQMPVQSDRMNYRDWVFDDFAKAKEVQDYLILRLEVYNVARVSDYYDKVEITPPPVASHWGWFDLSESRVSKVPGGWALDLPKPVGIDGPNR